MSRSKEQDRLYQLAHELYPDLELRLEVMNEIHRALSRLDDEGKFSMIEFLMMECLLTAEAKQRLIESVEQQAQAFVKTTTEKQ